MSKSISRVVDEDNVKKGEQEAINAFSEAAGRDTDEFTRLVKALSESGLISIITSIAENYQDVLATLTEELSDTRMSNFIRNLSAIYTLLSRIPPDIVRGFVNNSADEIISGAKNGDHKSLGLLSVNSLIKDSDVSSGLRILIGMMKGFTKPGKDGEK
ncbi:hypothetical protein Thermo_00359 [Thermoplasmatales archaeon]|nr:hypothetical protein Thermo_00359 [Thermoplasmatales archaeon]